MGRPQFSRRAESSVEVAALENETRFIRETGSVASGAAGSVQVDTKAAGAAPEVVAGFYVSGSGIPLGDMQVGTRLEDDGGGDEWEVTTNVQPVPMDPPLPYPAESNLNFQYNNNGTDAFVYRATWILAEVDN